MKQNMSRVGQGLFARSLTHNRTNITDTGIQSVNRLQWQIDANSSSLILRNYI